MRAVTIIEIIICFVSTLLLLLTANFYLVEREQAMFQSGMLLILFGANGFQWYCAIMDIKERQRKAKETTPK